MNENRSEKKTIWLYAVLLFTGAFVILLLTAYSQMKINKNSNEYQNQIMNEVKAKNSIATDLKTSLADNKKLTEELQKVKQSLNEEKQRSQTIMTDNEQLKEKTDKTLQAYEGIMEAENLFSYGDITGCALFLQGNVSISLLGSNGVERYNDLVGETFGRASLILFRSGLRDYRDEDYQKAATELNQSLSLLSDQYYSDDCYYYLGYAYYNMNDRDKAKVAFNTLLNQYKDSTYKQDAAYMLDKLNQ